MWQSLFFFSLIALGVALFYARRERLSAAQLLARERAHCGEIEKQLEHLRVASAAQRSAIFNSMLEGLLLLDSDLRVIETNTALQRIFALNTDVTGQNLIEALRLHRLVELANRVRAEGEVRDEELELNSLNPRLLEINGSLINDPLSQTAGILFVFHDLTHVKQLENVRKEFVANVSHELRTPLTLIKGYVETLIDGAKDDPAVAGRFLATIGKHADRLAFLIEDLLTISRLESGQLSLNTHPLALHALVDKILEDFESKAAAKEMKLVNAVPERLQLQADSDRLQQVLTNLSENAIKYGKARGSVKISAETEPAGSILISVRDDGPGIPLESRERIFERFYRVDRARSREQGGTGLGLSIVKHIIQAHGGEVWVESEIGHGSTFNFRLPGLPLEKPDR